MNKQTPDFLLIAKLEILRSLREKSDRKRQTICRFGFLTNNSVVTDK
ncbi:hypothetical protein [Fischerella muscicola]|nr:hypothetical protein [Fischerella muscicola]